MKQLFIVAFLSLALLSCKQENKDAHEHELEEVLEEGHQKFEGEFYYKDDVAVLTPVSNKVPYAIKVDEKMHELNQLVEPLKKNQYDMPYVVIHGTVQPNPLKLKTGEGWPEMITVTKIIEVAPAKQETAVVTPVNKNQEEDK